MPLSVKARITRSAAQKSFYRGLLTAVVLSMVLLSACKAAATQAKTPAATVAPTRNATRGTRPARTITDFPAENFTPFVPAARITQAPTETVAPTAIDTPLPSATAGTPYPTPFVMPTTSWFIYNMAADIQNHVPGVLNILSISGDNGTADIILRNAYWDKVVQTKASYGLVKYLATYFDNLDEKGIAALFGGSRFSIYIKSLSPTDQYIVETITPYDLMNQVGHNQVDQGTWEARVNAQIQMQYAVNVLCTVKPTSVAANTDTPLLIEGWLTHARQYDPIRYLTASWTDDTGRQYYCAGGEFDTSCRGHSGNVNPGSTITVYVGIEAADGMKFTCQATYSAP